MITHPTAVELVDVVARWIDSVRPSLTGRDAFMARVAANALGIVSRELTSGQALEAAAVERFSALLGQEGDFQTLNAELCRRLREGEMDRDTPGLLAALEACAVEQIAIDQPSYRADKA
ncbi:MAG: DUF6285 domain-containing protein [Phenylobacterium sp.]|uniref:DUF6285 domain-containing protein n=1 Tax=Phenylobacterium sp. TaxID=1871053 RepID=UPI00391AF5F3